MKKWLAVSFICSYLGTLSFGVFAHTYNVAVGSHPAMYFIVWDMFCGWSAYSTRSHVIAEGVSGDFYRVTPAPWGSFVPFGRLGREHYDSSNRFGGKLGINTLRHTDHEEMTRVLVVEESWPKKFNIPERHWAANNNGPRDVHKYHRIRAEYTPEGDLLQSQNSFVDAQVARIMTENPRLRRDSRRGDSPYIVNRQPTPQNQQRATIPGLAPNAQ